MVDLWANFPLNLSPKRQLKLLHCAIKKYAETTHNLLRVVCGFPLHLGRSIKIEGRLEKLRALFFLGKLKKAVRVLIK
jgi:hypothetical protein